MQSYSSVSWLVALSRLGSLQGDRSQQGKQASGNDNNTLCVACMVHAQHDVGTDLDELINLTNGWDIIWDEGLQWRFQLQHFRVVLCDVLKQVLHFFADWQALILIWVVTSCTTAQTVKLTVVVVASAAFLTCAL